MSLKTLIMEVVMLHAVLGAIIFICFATATNQYFKARGGEPAYSNKIPFRVGIASLMLFLNFLDWYTTKHIVAMGGLEQEGNRFLRIIFEQSPYYGNFHKLVVGSIIVTLAAFAIRNLDALCGLIFLLALILIANSITLLLVMNGADPVAVVVSLMTNS